MVVFVGYSIRDTADAAPKKQATKVQETTTTTSTTTTTTTLPPEPGQPAAANLPLLGNGVTLGSGSTSANMAQYEQRFVDLKMDPGTVDTVFDGKTFFAVQTLQKLKGLPVTGRLGDPEILALNTFKYDAPLAENPEANRAEVSLDKQVAILYENYNVKLMTAVSTGNGAKYCYTSKKSGRRVCSVANTPTGRYEVTWRYKGWKVADLGKLYNPVYFNGGIAFHGYSSVPTKPASHGCVRLPMYIASYFPGLIPNGTAVYVHGNRPVPNIADKVGGVVNPTTTTTAATSTTSTTAAPTTTTTASTTPPTLAPDPEA